MPSLKDTKRRITSVKNTQKITHAMKLVSAAKFARANQAVLASRLYRKKIKEFLANCLANPSLLDEGENPWFLPRKNSKKVLVVLINTDRGLCGSLNTNIQKLTLRHILALEKQGKTVELFTAGKRASQFAKKFKLPVVSSQEKVLDKPSVEGSLLLAENIWAVFEKNEDYEKVYLGFVEFRSALSQTPRFCQILPFEKESVGEEKVEAPLLTFEPTTQEALQEVARRYYRSFIHGALLESAASEHGARMTAMDTATKNAKEVIRKLTLVYNRSRQAAITRELIEITSGAEAL